MIGSYKEIVNKVKEESEPICCYCHKYLSRDEMTVDHLIPISRGGKTVESNLAVCCYPCNLEKGNMTYYEYLEYKKSGIKKLDNKICFRYNDMIYVNYIIIPRLFQQSNVSDKKLNKIINFYKEHKHFDKPVTLKSKNKKVLLDGYVRYVAAKTLNLKKVPVTFMV